MKRNALAAGAASLSLLLAACGSSTDTTTTPTPAGPATSETTTSSDTSAAGGITIQNFAYSGSMTVKAGEKVSVTNKDDKPHTVTDKGGAFDSGKIDASGSGSFTAPKKAGTYELKCSFHPNMKGQLVVS